MNPEANSNASTILALDYGARRIGVATGSTITATASALETLVATGTGPDWHRIEELVQEWSPRLIVLGLPPNTDGTESEMTREVKTFAAELQTRCGIPVEFVDERYTSAEAEALLREQRRQGLRTKKLRKEDVDAAAAQLIATSWLENAASKT